MGFEEFVDKVLESGWEGVSDAQYCGIEKLWRELFPYSAKLEDELAELQAEYRALAGEFD